MKKTSVKTTRKKATNRGVKKTVVAAARLSEASPEARLPVMPPEPAAIPEAPAPKAKTKPAWWIQALIAAAAVLVTVEVVMIAQSKLARQGRLELIRVIGQRGGPPEQQGRYWAPVKIRVDDQGQRVALTDSSFGKVLFWDTASGALLKEMDQTGEHAVAPDGAVRAGEFLPVDGAFDPEGRFFALDRQHGRITVFSPDYRVESTWTVPTPGGIAIDAQGAIYLSEVATKTLVVYNAAGQEQRRFSAAAVQIPGSMACDEEGTIYLIDRGAENIKVYSAAGKLRRAWKPQFQPFGNPDIDVKNGMIFLCEHNNQRVLIYTPKGKLLTSMAVVYPAVLAADPQGRLYISAGAGINQSTLVKSSQ